ncbi:hypothetical protein ACJX0J_025244, partial [Zea mays]
KKEEDNMTMKNLKQMTSFWSNPGKKENIEKEHKKFLASIKKSETLGKSQKVKKGVAPLMRHMISQYKFQGFGISLAGLKYLKGWDWNLKGKIGRKLNIDTIMCYMEKNKAAGPDSIPAEFYQICWDIVKKDNVSLFQDFHAGHLDTKEATKIQQLKKGRRLAYDKVNWDFLFLSLQNRGFGNKWMMVALSTLAYPL